MDNILTVEHVSKSYTGHKALDDVSLEVPRGAIYGLLGPNGAGKTTLIRVITRITLADSGRVLLDGKQITADDVFHIGYMPEERGLYKKMRVGEQAMFFARLKGMPKRDAEARLKEWFERLEIADWWERKVEDLSKGMAQKVQFISTVVHEPKLLIFDEPFSGFDPINAGILKREILRLRDEGATVIFSTHNMASVEELCDEITLINKSHNILSGSLREVRERFADNRYELAFTGDPSALLAADGFQVSLGPVNTDGFATADVRLASPADVRAFLARANEAVEINAFRAVLPTMDDIFINAVEQSNMSNPETTES